MKYRLKDTCPGIVSRGKGKQRLKDTCFVSKGQKRLKERKNIGKKRGYLFGS